MSSGSSGSVDWGIVLNGVITFLAVLSAFFLALWQDRYRERREESKDKRGLMDLFKVELYSILMYLQTNQLEIKFPIYFDVWDSAKTSGKLALLTSEEYSLLNSIYIEIRAINDQIQDHNERLVSRTPGVLTGKENFEAKIFREKGGLMQKIESVRNRLWPAPIQASTPRIPD